MSAKEQNVWSSKYIFILAAIGSAAGLGNLWKFPFLVYDNGGASFIVAYLVILFFIGFSLLIGEIALGQKTRSGAPDAFSEINKNFKWLGYFCVFGAFGILSYYMVVIGWGIDYLYYSVTSLFSGNFAWSQDSAAFFFNDILGITSSVNEIGKFSFKVFLGTLFASILMYFFTFKSAKSVGKTVLFTATFPFIAIFILAIRGATLPGAGEGLSYLTTVNLDTLFMSSTWIAAAGQIFFTLSVAMGVMIAYGALKKEKSEIVKSCIIVALGNTLVSILGAIAIFGTLGYLAQVNGVADSEVAKGGPSLVFVVFPEILSKLPALNSIFAILFFLTIFTLAVDSAMSLLEGVSIPIKNKFKKLKTEHITLGLISLLFLSNLIYMFGNGLYILDIFDRFITQFGMLIIGIFELVLFLIYGKKFRKYIKEHNKLKFINTNLLKFSWILGVVVLSVLFLINISGGILVYDSYSKQQLVTFGLAPLLLMLTLSVLFNFAENSKLKK